MGPMHANKSSVFTRKSNLTRHPIFLFIISINPLIEQSSSHEQILNELFLSWLMVQLEVLNHYCASYFPGKLFENADSWDLPLEVSSSMGQISLCLQVPR